MGSLSEGCQGTKPATTVPGYQVQNVVVRAPSGIWRRYKLEPIQVLTFWWLRVSAPLIHTPIAVVAPRREQVVKDWSWENSGREIGCLGCCSFQGQRLSTRLGLRSWTAIKRSYAGRPVSEQHLLGQVGNILLLLGRPPAHFPLSQCIQRTSVFPYVFARGWKVHTSLRYTRVACSLMCFGRCLSAVI
jgi:hypothetical protein